MWGGEELIIRPDLETGAWLIVALHSPVLGSATVGTRAKNCACLDEAVTDALRQSSGMTRKFAAPGLPFGGGKAVSAVPPILDGPQRTGLLER